jgi:hypothetical protein
MAKGSDISLLVLKPQVLESSSPYHSHYTNRAILAQHATYLTKILVDTLIFLLVFAWCSSVYTEE